MSTGREDKDPTRILEGDDEPELLRSMLREAQRATPSEDALARLSFRLELTVGPKGPSPSGPIARGGLKLIIGAGAFVALVGGGLWFALNKEEPRSLPVSPAPILVTPASSTPKEVKEVAPEPKPPPVPTGPKVKVKAKVKVERERPGLSEVELLRRAQKLISDDPDRAFRMAERHRSRFPAGDLVEEREVIAIIALSEIGQTEAARRRLARFLKRFPGSAHQRKLDRLRLGESDNP